MYKCLKRTFLPSSCYIHFYLNLCIVNTCKVWSKELGHRYELINIRKSLTSPYAKWQYLVSVSFLVINLVCLNHFTDVGKKDEGRNLPKISLGHGRMGTIQPVPWPKPFYTASWKSKTKFKTQQTCSFV